MLKGIPGIIGPDLMKAMMEMGHGDEIVLADANFPASSLGPPVTRCDGSGLTALLDAVLTLFPLDRAADSPVVLMEPMPDGARPDIWESYRTIVARHEPAAERFLHLERFVFYERAKRAYAIVITGEQSPRANVILKKGVVRG